MIAVYRPKSANFEGRWPVLQSRGKLVVLLQYVCGGGSTTKIVLVITVIISIIFIALYIPVIMHVSL